MESRNWQQLRTRALARARARAGGGADKEPLRRLLRPLELSVRLKNGGICTVDYSRRVDEMSAFYAYYLGVISLTRSKTPPTPSHVLSTINNTITYLPGWQIRFDEDEGGALMKTSEGETKKLLIWMNEILLHVCVNVTVLSKYHVFVI